MADTPKAQGILHVREATTPMPNGTLLADCSCGAEYSVPQGGDEYGALEAEHDRHVAEETPHG